MIHFDKPLLLLQLYNVRLFGNVMNLSLCCRGVTNVSRLKLSIVLIYKIADRALCPTAVMSLKLFSKI